MADETWERGWRVMSDLMEFGSRDEFRKWLCDNCLSSAGIWVLFGKAGGPKTMKAGEALEEALCFGWIDGQMEKIDEKISTVAKGWTLGRMGKVDLSLIRLAVYEMLYDEEVPVGVAINEAVELAKIFGQDGSSSFVNGLLAKVLLLDEPLERNEI